MYIYTVQMFGKFQSHFAYFKLLIERKSRATEDDHEFPSS